MAFSTALNKQVEPFQIPPQKWIPSLTAIGFSEKAAASMAAMTHIVLEKKYELPSSPFRGKITLQEHVTKLVNEWQMNRLNLDI